MLLLINFVTKLERASRTILRLKCKFGNQICCYSSVIGIESANNNQPLSIIKVHTISIKLLKLCSNDPFQLYMYVFTARIRFVSQFRNIPVIQYLLS